MNVPVSPRDMAVPEDSSTLGMGVLGSEEWRQLDAYWRAANDLSVAIPPAFDMRVQNDIDRFYLVQDVVDNLSDLGGKGAYLKQAMRDKLIRHKHYIDEHGEDLPEIRNWR